MEESLKIRKATPEDSVGLSACMESAYSIYQDRMGGVRLPPMDVDYLYEINNYPTWVVDSDGYILGGLIMAFEKDRASITNIAVSARSHGQGIGGQLMRFAESRAREKGYSKLHLATHVLLDENLSIYRHLGWKETRRNETRVMLSKNI